MFTYRGKTFEEMGLIVENEVLYQAPTSDINFIEVPGRDGDIPISNNRKSSVVKSIPITLISKEQDIENSLTTIHDWLFTNPQYQDFKWGDDADFTYKAMFHDGMLTMRQLKNRGKTDLRVRLHPIKFLNRGLEYENNPSSIHNPFHNVAKPIIRIEGSGDIVANIGDYHLVLREVDGGVIVNSQTMTITSLDGQRPQWDKMFSPFPRLSKGVNEITFQGADNFQIKSMIGALIT